MDNRLCQSLIATGLIVLCGSARQTWAQAESPTDGPAAALPSAAGLIADSLELMDAAAFLDGLTTLTTEADCEGPRGAFKTTVHSAPPDRTIFRQVAPDEPVFSGYVHGEIAWTTSSESDAVSQVDEPVAAMFRGHEFHLIALHLGRRFHDHKTIGHARFDGVDCFEVAMLDRANLPAAAYFEVASGRLRGMMHTNPMPRGARSLTVTYGDWKPVAGATLFTAATITHGEEVFTYRFTSIRRNAIGLAEFAVPPAVRALAQERGDSTASRPGT